jgi:PleD family two-component response regulator
MDSGSARIVIVTSNSGINDTLSAALSEFCPGSDIRSYTDEYEALWQATDVQPDIVIVWYGPKSGKSYKLLKRLRLSLKEFQGIVVYEPESGEYQSALLQVLSRDQEYAGILPVRIDMFGEKMREILNKVPRPQA